MARTGNDNAYNMNQSSWVPQLSAGQDEGGSILDLFNSNSAAQEKLPVEQGYSPAVQQGLKAGLQSQQAGGGLGGTLTSAGATAALAGAGPVGWGVMAGGLLLSAHEKKKQEEASREQAKIDAEMLRRNNLITLARDSANIKTQWV
jgi:hypothetical protein